MARAEIEWLSGVMRVWIDDKADYGEPYDYICHVSRVERGVYELLGVMDAPTPTMWRAMYRELQRVVIRLVLWTRKRADGTTDKRHLEIKPCKKRHTLEPDCCNWPEYPPWTWQQERSSDD